MHRIVDPAPPELDPAADPCRRIALVITRSDAVGGAQVHVQLIARALLDAGHDVRVFVGGRGHWFSLLEAQNIPVTSLRALRRPIRPLLDAAALLEVGAALRAFGPDLVSAHGTKAGWLARIAARRLGVPACFTVHGQPLGPGPLAPARRLVRMADRACARGGGAVIFVSNYDRRVCAEHGVGLPHQHVVVHNALPEVPAQLRADPAARPPEVLMVARLERPKQPELALDALAQVRDHPWKFTLVGEGGLRGAVESRVRAHGLQDRVELVGAVDDVPQRLALSQLFVLASTREGLPLSVLEAMRAGLPVVTTDAGGAGEAVLDGVTGFVTPRRDVAAFAGALRRLITDEALRVRMGAASRARFEAEFSFPRHLRRIWAVYRRTMRETRRR